MYLRKTVYFDEYYHSDELDMIIKTKKENGIMDPDEEWIDVKEEISALEGSAPSRSEILSGRDLQNAIDNALDVRDFKEVERLSKMLPECYGFKAEGTASIFS
jgi:O-phosphoseryl-tRNA(Cys) synthetase